MFPEGLLRAKISLFLPTLHYIIFYYLINVFITNFKEILMYNNFILKQRLIFIH